MPKIEVKERNLFSYLGKELTDEQLLDILPVAKAELDGHEGDVLKIELNDTNRPDLWSAPGVSRLLASYEGRRREYPFFSTKENEQDCGGRQMYIHESAASSGRNYSIGFCADGHAVSEQDLELLIQSQEKLCDGYGRKRRSVAIGIYRSSLISFPVHYEGADPDKCAFTPLGMDEKLTLREICEKHPKGIEYGYIHKEMPRYPYLRDDKGETLSFPPVINSARIGAVQAGDDALFVEMSGPELEPLMLCAAILSCDMADMGFTIKPVKVHLDQKRAITVPCRFQSDVRCPVSLVGEMLGEELSAEQCVESLKKMDVDSRIEDGDLVVSVPAYRNDFLHPSDVVEEIMIGYGLDNFIPEPPHDFTVGRLSAEEEFARRVQRIMVGLGFQEMIYNYLGSRKEYADNMHLSDEKCVVIAKPMSENYEVVRPSIMPSLLETEGASGHAAIPHKFFETGKVCYRKDDENSGTITRNHLGFLMADNLVGYNEVSSLLYTLMYFLNVEYTLGERAEDPRFIPGRCATILVKGKPVGCFGEIHPRVLESWDCGYPAVTCEIDLDELLSLI